MQADEAVLGADVLFLLVVRCGARVARFRVDDRGTVERVLLVHQCTGERGQDETEREERADGARSGGPAVVARSVHVDGGASTGSSAPAV